LIVDTFLELDLWCSVDKETAGIDDQLLRREDCESKVLDGNFYFEVKSDLHKNV
jgi:hypothetical protein